MPSSSEEVTQLLLRWSKGDSQAFEQLVPLVSVELRRLARRHLNRERADHTLQTSALINEAYLRLIRQHDVAWQDRAHFFALAAQIMHRVLIDYARRYQSEKRGAGNRKVSLDEAGDLGQERAKELIELDEALASLASFDSRKSEIVRLRFFGGLSIEEIAATLDLSAATVKRELQSARLWLRRFMTTDIAV